MTLFDIQVVLLLIVPVLPAAAALLLVTTWTHKSVALRERTLLALRDWIVASLAALLALNRILHWQWPSEFALSVLAFALLLVSLPSAWWLYLFWRGRFR